MVETSARDLGPQGGIGSSRAEIADRPLMADTFHGIRQFTVRRDEFLEVLLSNPQQITIFSGTDCRSARIAAQQRQLPERMTLAEHCD